MDICFLSKNKLFIIPSYPTKTKDPTSAGDGNLQEELQVF